MVGAEAKQGELKQQECQESPGSGCKGGERKMRGKGPNWLAAKLSRGVQAVALTAAGQFPDLECNPAHVFHSLAARTPSNDGFERGRTDLPGWDGRQFSAAFLRPTDWHSPALQADAGETLWISDCCARSPLQVAP